jgi:hypothetical protein
MELKHIIGYLPYGLKGNYEVSEVVQNAKFEIRNKKLRTDNLDFFLSYAKPILRPLSDLTKEIEVNGTKFIPLEYNAFKHSKQDIIEFQNNFIHYKGMKYGILERLFEWHFDVFGLIEKGEAIDINTLKQQ